MYESIKGCLMAETVDRRQRMTSALVVSAVYHMGAVAIVLLTIRSGLRSGPHEARVVRPLHTGIVWLTQAGGGREGNGGGNRIEKPPRRVELRGDDTLTVPVIRTPRLEASTAVTEPNPIERLIIPAERLASGLDSLMGALAGTSTDVASLGPGLGRGAGAGNSDGDGDGSRNRHGTDRFGSDDGYGAEGVQPPRVLVMVRPHYTTEAMSARVQGSVLVGCLVQADGRVGDARIERSLDRVFGLDQEAIKAARQWQFRPGTRVGRPVPVRVAIEIMFRLR